MSVHLAEELKLNGQVKTACSGYLFRRFKKWTNDPDKVTCQKCSFMYRERIESSKGVRVYGPNRAATKQYELPDDLYSYPAPSQPPISRIAWPRTFDDWLTASPTLREMCKTLDPDMQFLLRKICEEIEGFNNGESFIDYSVYPRGLRYLLGGSDTWERARMGTAPRLPVIIRPDESVPEDKVYVVNTDTWATIPEDAVPPPSTAVDRAIATIMRFAASRDAAEAPASTPDDDPSPTQP